VKPVVLITDAQTPLGETLVKLYLDRGYAVAAVGSRPQSASAPPASESDNVLRVDWSRRSPISTRNALLSVLNRFGRIDETVVLLSPSLERGLLHELSYETVERAVDSWIKGTLFLLKGVLDLYRNQSTQRQPILALVELADQEEGTAFPPLEAALRGSFEATARSLISSYDGESLRVRGFSGFDPQTKGFAEFIVQTLSGRTTRAAARWHRFPPKSGLLGNLKIPRG
jgi:NAD(P)-dependent dehydrogenase (short-subunit alcohol dehydrogenase family)